MGLIFTCVKIKVKWVFNMNQIQKLEFVTCGLKILRASIEDEYRYITIDDIDNFFKLYIDIVES